MAQDTPTFRCCCPIKETLISYSRAYATLHLGVADQIAEIRLSRPDLLNRFDMAAHADLNAALREVAASETARVLVLLAEGRVFSAGGDFDEMLEANRLPALRDRMVREARDVVNGLIDLPVPVIAAVQGAAMGLGATLASLSDMVVAWRGAKIADTHVNVGLVAGDGGVLGWPQSIGLNRAKRHLFTGDPMTGEQAYAYGLVTDLVDTPEEVAPAARALAERIRKLAPEGVRGTKRAFAALTRARAAETVELGLALEMESMTSPTLPDTVAQLRRR